MLRGDQDPELFFEFLATNECQWDDIKQIFGHQLLVYTKLEKCSHYSEKNNNVSLAYRMPLPENRTILHDYIIQNSKKTSKLDDYWCEICYSSKTLAREKGALGAYQTTQLKNLHNNRFLLINFDAPPGVTEREIEIYPQNDMVIRYNISSS